VRTAEPTNIAIAASGPEGAAATALRADDAASADGEGSADDAASADGEGSADGDGCAAGEGAAAGATRTGFELLASRQFTAWLGEQNASLALTTYQAGTLFLLGLNADGRLSLFNRTFDRCMAVCAEGDTLYLSTLYQLWRFESVLLPGQMHQGHDRLYVPQLAYTTGDVDVHEIAVDGTGRPIFVNTLFSCLATVSERYSFAPLWHPPFVSKLAAEDRCHLNGVAMAGGEPRFATAVARSDVADGWRDHRESGGVLIDVKSGDVVLDGLSMPHCPRMHGDRLWLLESGTGYFGYADLERGRFERVAFCPGYARGLTIVGDFAVIGLSKARRNRTFSGLALDRNLGERGAEARCGLIVIDLATGDSVHWLRIEGVVEELYGIAHLPSVRRPMAVGLKTDEIRRVISLPPGQRRANAGELAGRSR
jgi:uncharacterized protein (TIGR03032 family)